MSDECPSSPDSRSFPDNRRDTSQDGQISMERLHRLLASERRRHLLSYLSTNASHPVSREELVDVIAEWEQPDPGPETHRVRIETDLHHVHLPKLADAEVIDYDPVTEAVYYNGSDRLESFLAAGTAVEDEPE